MTRYSLAFLLILPAVMTAQFTDVINSNRPGESMAAFSVGKTVFQTEFGFSGVKEKNSLEGYNANTYGADLTLRYGAFFEQLEFIFDAQYNTEKYVSPPINQSRSGFRKASLGAKFLIFDPNKSFKEPNLYSWVANHKFDWHMLVPAVGVYAGANFNLSDNKFSRPGIPKDKSLSPKLMVLTQNQFGRYVLVGNVMLDNYPSDNQSINYVVTLTRGFNQYWSGFIENQGFFGDYYTDAYVRGGAARLIKQNLQVDASIGVNVKNAPSKLFGGIGVSWRWDANYEDVYLRLPGAEDSKLDKKSKKMKDKNEKEKNKRLDAIDGGK